MYCSSDKINDWARYKRDFRENKWFWFGQVKVINNLKSLNLRHT